MSLWGKIVSQPRVLAQIAATRVSTKTLGALRHRTSITF